MNYTFYIYFILDYYLAIVLRQAFLKALLLNWVAALRVSCSFKFYWVRNVKAI